MIILFYAVLILLLTIGGISIILFFIFALDSLIQGHDLSTSRRATRALIDLIKQYKPSAKNFYDLGCGRGALSLRIKKALPSLEVEAIDNNTIRIFFAKLKSKILGRKINFRKQNIFEANLRQADIVYAYLWYDLMPPLEKKLQNELKSGAIVVTNTSNFPSWQSTNKINTYPKFPETPNLETLFVYTKTDSKLKDIKRKNTAK